MRIEFNDIKHKFDIGILDRKQVLGLVSCGLITFDDYRKITDKDYREPKNPGKLEGGELRLTAGRVDRVTTAVAKGPRGDYYDWCNLLENETLEFGDEQGNYAGGATLSYRYYGDRDTPYPRDHPATTEYWGKVVHELKWLKNSSKEYERDFYQKIVDMCKRNKAGSVLALIDKIEKGEL